MITQSELSEGKTNIKVRLIEEDTPVDPKAIIVNWGNLPKGGDITDTAANVRTLTLTGDLSAVPQDYLITLEYTTPDGQTVTGEVTVTVTESVFDIQPVFTKTLRFLSVQELETNQEKYRFEVTADGRKLTDDEMMNFTNLVVDPNSDCAEWEIKDSGYNVLPHAKHGWIPAQNDITYTVRCEAPGKTETIDFIYHLAEYEVACINGDGTYIDADYLIDNTKGLTFQVYFDGVPLLYEEVEPKYRISVISPFDKIDLEKTVAPDGSVTIIPRSHAPKYLDYFIRPLPFLRPTGDMQVTLSFENKQSTGTLHLTPGGFGHWRPYLYLICSIILIILYSKKKRFKHNSCIYFCSCVVDGRTITGLSNLKPWPLTSDWLYLILPAVSHQTVVKGLHVRAADLDIEVLISGHKVVKEVSNYINVHEIPRVTNPIYQEPFKSGWQTMRSEDAIIVYEKNGTATLYKYFAEK